MSAGRGAAVVLMAGLLFAAPAQAALGPSGLPEAEDEQAFLFALDIPFGEIVGLSLTQTVRRLKFKLDHGRPFVDELDEVELLAGLARLTGLPLKMRVPTSAAGEELFAMDEDALPSVEEYVQTGLLFDETGAAAVNLLFEKVLVKAYRSHPEDHRPAIRMWPCGQPPIWKLR